MRWRLRAERDGERQGKRKTEEEKLTRHAEHGGIIAMENGFYKSTVTYGREQKGATGMYVVRQGKAR